MPAAAREGDLYLCTFIQPDLAVHANGKLEAGKNRSVFINRKAAIVVDDSAECTGQTASFPEKALVKGGSSTVYIQGKKAARITDTTSHSSMVITGPGSPNVNIGG